MEILSPARIHTAAIQAAPQSRHRAEAELVRLRAQVAWLRAERAALWWAVDHDGLTGLASRRRFYAMGPPLLRGRRGRAVLIVLDLNGFKSINDRFGHATGDEVLRIVAQRIALCAGDDLAARLGGDEFAAVLTSDHPQSCDRWWQRSVAILAAAIAEPIPIAGHTLTVTASIGIAPADRDAPIGELLHRADQAMYQAKASGTSHVAWSADAVDGIAYAGGGRCILGHQDQRREAITASDNGPKAGTSMESANDGQDPPHGGGVIELALFPETEHDGRPVSAPTCDSFRRDPAYQAAASTYRRGDPVWVNRNGAWRPGIVEDASASTVMVTYRCAEGRGTVVDTMSAEYVLPRAGADDRRLQSTPSMAARSCSTATPVPRLPT